MKQFTIIYVLVVLFVAFEMSEAKTNQVQCKGNGLSLSIDESGKVVANAESQNWTVSGTGVFCINQDENYLSLDANGDVVLSDKCYQWRIQGSYILSVANNKALESNKDGSSVFVRNWATGGVYQNWRLV